MTVPAQRVGGVLLQGRALADCAYLVAAGIRAAYRDDGISASPRLRYLADLLTAAARDASASGPPHVRDVPTSSTSTSLLDEITTTEAATMLGLSQRQMRRLAPLLGGRHTSAGWLVHRGAVAAHRQGRTAA